MNHINIKKFGLAFGLTGSIMYFGCALVMMILGHESTIKFFNSLLHGFDVSTIIRMDVPPVEVFFGIIQTFILGWLIAACIASIYNISMKSEKNVKP